MLIARLHKFITAPAAKTPKSNTIFWLSLSLTFAAFYGLLALQEAFSSKYVVQDDVRQHVFWMQRFLDPQLFPNDLIANYFQSVAPAGYTALYRVLAAVGINPLLASKLLPAVLGLIATGYCFSVCTQLLPVPAAGFIASLLLNQSMWMKDDLVSATPRAFAFPIFLAFLHYLLRRSLPGTGISIALIGLFYPQYVFIAAGAIVLQLVRWEGGRLQLTQNRRDYWFCAALIAVAILVLLPFALKTSEFGPTITAAEARKMPEFLPGGRSSFFSKNPVVFWIDGRGSAILPSRQTALVWFGLLLPVLLRYPALFPLAKQVTSGVRVLPQIALVSVAMFFAAHAVLFKLHLPSRYTGHSFRIVLALAGGIALTVLLDAVFQWAENQTKDSSKRAKIIAFSCFLLTFTTLFLYPAFVKNFPKTSYQVGGAQQLYYFFAQQPKDTLIASLAEEANNLPTFSQRSILVGREYAIPYHVGYYRRFRERTVELIEAQYSQDLAPAKQLIQKYGIDFWLLEPSSFTPEYLIKNHWRWQFEPAKQAAERLKRGKMPALAGLVGRCSVFDREGFSVLPADCILKAGKK
ncbi:hypothetical protein [Kamptonema formosum]|uniref:hypothetical protein n=1 Tax=Kamptonema formosum TaxID=331992 RepID=UPI00034CA146|nr:hypothetical protein [Oscillatoria sp. PCC 10802]